MPLRLLPLLLLLTLTTAAHAQQPTLRQQLQTIIAGKKAHIGVSVRAVEDKDTLSINAAAHYPMQSVFKFHLALLVLHKVDEGTLQLDKPVHIKQQNLQKDTWSPLREAHTAPEFDLSLKEILRYTVSESDNNGCDLLFNMVGGPAAVNRYIHALSIKEVNIAANEAQMHAAWDVQYRNWTTPTAATQLLQKCYMQPVLSAGSKELLLRYMRVSGKTNRLGSRLPQGAEAAHKAGTSGTNAQHLTAAFNDIGIITLPSGKHIAVAVFISNSLENEAVNYRIIADIGRAVWDYYTRQNQSATGQVYPATRF